MSRVQVLVADEANRNALVELLSKEYDVSGGTEPNGAACYVVDDRTFPECREAIERVKADAAPVFLPVVLVRREDTRIDIQLPEHDEERTPLIDEIVTAPVDPPVLFRRLSNLLVRRDREIELYDQRERLEDFASVVSHDLRNPLSIALTYAPMVRSGIEDGSDATEHLDTMVDALHRMDDLIDDVLTAARKGGTVSATERLSLASVAREAWGNVVTYDANLVCEDADAPVEAERDRLLKVFENLFRNAVEHGGESVTVSVGFFPDGSGFYVEDDGSGIDGADVGSVFEQGFTTEEHGTGLGLAIVADTADAHGWTVEVTESSAGGARFEFRGVV
jgi:signal transduction histidine kinase